MAKLLQGGRFSGKVDLFQPMIARVWKGTQVFQRLSQRTVPLSSHERMVSQLMGVYAHVWNSSLLTQQHRWSWAEFCRGKKMTPHNAFLGCHIKAAKRGLCGPFPWAPISPATPPPPSELHITWDTSRKSLILTWSDPPCHGLFPPDSHIYLTLHLWLYSRELNNRRGGYSQILTTLQAPTPQRYEVSDVWAHWTPPSDGMKPSRGLRPPSNRSHQGQSSSAPKKPRWRMIPLRSLSSFHAYALADTMVKVFTPYPDLAPVFSKPIPSSTHVHVCPKGETQQEKASYLLKQLASLQKRI